MHPHEIRISDYTYSLPEEKIAHHPLAERDASKLLLYQNGNISESIYRNIADFILAGSLLVFNNTRVIQARLFFENEHGGKVEVFCLEPLENHKAMASAMSRKKTSTWKCLIGRASKWKEKILQKDIGGLELCAEIVDRTKDSFVVTFYWQPEDLSFAEVLDQMGEMPIPPYLHRRAEETDATRYQTVYAKQDGSVAAPTAGLHFTQNIFASLNEKKIETAEVTLHVGAGTFKPVKSETMAGHDMHAERIDVHYDFLKKLITAKSNHRPVIAVGTTSARTLESLYWMGIKAIQNPDASMEEIEVKQWDAYQLKTNESALEALLHWMEKKQLERLICSTQLIIAPPYRAQVVAALVTNFHQPNSTLLLLVAALVGEDWKKIYDYALAHQFRFLSYGDGSLLFIK